MLAREMWSNAPTPSTLSTVVRPSASQATRTAPARDSAPAQVRSASSRLEGACALLRERPRHDAPEHVAHDQAAHSVGLLQAHHPALRLRYFEANITPTVLYGLTTLSLAQSQLDRLDAAQRRVLRFVGWVRIEGEDWRDTTHRMKLRLRHALAIHPLRPWTQQLFARQYRFACKISRRDDAWPWAVVTRIPGDGWTHNFLKAPRRK